MRFLSLSLHEHDAERKETIDDDQQNEIETAKKKKRKKEGISEDLCEETDRSMIRIKVIEENEKISSATHSPTPANAPISI